MAFSSPIGAQAATSAKARTPAVGAFGLLRRYLRSLVEVSGWKLAIAVGAMAVTSLTEGIAVILLFPILSAAGFDFANQGHVAHYTGEVRDWMAWSGLPQDYWLAILLGVFVVLMALRSLFSRAQTVMTYRTVLEYELALSRRLYQSIVGADWLFLTSRRSSDFTHALTGEMTRVSTGTYRMIGALSNAILALVYIGFALKLSAVMTAMVLAAGLILTLASRHWMRAVHESGAAITSSVSEVYSAATEHLQNLKAMKTYGAQARDLQMFSSLQASALSENLRNTRNQAASAFWFESGSLLVLGAVIFVSLQILKIPPVAVLLLLAVFTRLMPRLSAGNAQIQAFLGDLPAFGNILRIQEECGKHAEIAGDGGSELDLRRELRLEGVSFTYDRQRERVLRDVSLSIPAGRITALAGASGAGKSTIADLVNGLLFPERGRVLIDAMELTPARAAAWRRHVGYVGQDTVLFHDTVRANLLWAEPGATTEEINGALELAAADFVFDLPLGLETVAGDRGILFSHGQRQRIALARALLRRPSVLLLDEATASLDLENEKKILDAIEEAVRRLNGRLTVLMIAHRPSAMQRADLIYVVEDGRIAAAGTWKELSTLSAGAFSHLTRLQNAPV